ncbi:MAG: hypothetical protein SGJ19_24415 [Planctomycetia bacterium]|nr:hypothetical protein [Planctomycetia bacterium]
MSDPTIPVFANLSEPEWESVKQRFPIVTVVTGRVVSTAPFGIFLDFGAGVLGIIEIVTLRLSPDARSLPPDRHTWPKQGELASGRVIGFREHNRQVGLEWLLAN